MFIGMTPGLVLSCAVYFGHRFEACCCYLTSDKLPKTRLPVGFCDFLPSLARSAMAKAALNRAGEDRIGRGVLLLAAQKTDGEITLRELKRRLEEVVPLTDSDLRESETRPGEPLFHQIIRNIVSHKGASGNLITEGLLEHIGKARYRITDAGRTHIRAVA